MSKTNKIILWIIGLIIVIGLIWLGYSEKQPVVEGETIKIGVSLPLSGEGASFGEAGMGGIKLAQKEINEKEGVLGKEIELIIEDNQCNAPEGVNAMNKLVNIDNVSVIVGVECSSSAGASLPIAQNKNIPVLISGSSAPDLAKVGDYIFRKFPSDSLQGKYAAEYIFNKLNKRKVAILYVNNDWGLGLRNFFKENFEKLGGEILFDEGITQETIDMRTSITKIKGTEAELLYFPVYMTNAVSGLRQLKELGFEGIVFGGDGFDSDEIKKTEQAEGVLFMLGKTSNPEEFQNRIKEVSEGTINYLTPHIYDALYIMTQAIERAGSLDRELIRDELAKTSYKGVALPLVEFDENGDLKEADFEVRIIKNGESIPYEIQ